MAAVFFRIMTTGNAAVVDWRRPDSSQGTNPSSVPPPALEYNKRGRRIRPIGRVWIDVNSPLSA